MERGASMMELNFAGVQLASQILGEAPIASSLSMSQILMLFLAAFVQIAIAVDVPGILPIYVGMTDGMEEPHRRTLLRNSLAAGFIVGLIFVLVGKLALELLGIQVCDFQMAGGLVLILIGVLDLVGHEKTLRRPAESLGVVPLGIPLIVGPAVISVMFLLVGHSGTPVTLMAFVANLILVGVAFLFAPAMTRWVGRDGMMAMSKVMMLLMIAVGVRMVRLGIITAFFGQNA